MTITVAVPPPVVLAPQISVGQVPVSNAALSSATVLAASTAPSGRARPVQSPTDPTRIAGQESSLAIGNDADQAPIRDFFADPDNLPQEPPTAPVEAAPIMTVPFSRSLLRTWDDAITAHVAEGDTPSWPTDTVVPPRSYVGEPSATALDATLMAGVAVALWGAWEIRSWRDDRRRQRLAVRHAGR
jgi:hypothetical protein